MTSTGGTGSAPEIDLETIVGSVTAVLTPQITKMIQAELTRHGAAGAACKSPETGHGTVNEERGGRASRNKSSGRGLADMEIDTPEGGNSSEETPHKSNGRSDRKRKSRSDDECGEISDSTDDEEKIFDPIEMYQESKGTWRVPNETARYIDSYAKRSLNKDERKSMLDVFPRPDVTSAAMPRVDEAFLNLLKQQGISLK